MTKIAFGNSRGQSVVEMTLMLPFLLILVGGATDWGLAFLASNVVQNAAREGARLAATLQNLEADDPRVLDAIDANIPDVGLFSSITRTNAAPTGAACEQAVTVQVSVNYSFTFLRLIGLKDPIPIEHSTTMRYERQSLVC